MHGNETPASPNNTHINLDRARHRVTRYASLTSFVWYATVCRRRRSQQMRDLPLAVWRVYPLHRPTI